MRYESAQMETHMLYIHNDCTHTQTLHIHIYTSAEPIVIFAIPIPLRVIPVLPIRRCARHVVRAPHANEKSEMITH